MKKPNGLVLFEGPSLLDGAPIVVIATGLASGSTNRKTGDMVQTYILRADVSPIDALKTGADVSICGNCPARGTPKPGGRLEGRVCYVNVGQGPLSVWRAYKRGVYPAAAAANVTAAGSKRVVRLGTYGDPAAAPVTIWQELISEAVAHTGYTHQWRTAPQLRSLCMASADSVADATEAQALGWRTFRVRMPTDAKRQAAEVVCPASAEAGKALTCTQCRACGGAAKGRRGSIVINAHGGFAVMANVRKLAQLQGVAA